MTIENIRQFNRYYTRILGVFDKRVFNLDYSMIDMRILGEIARNKGTTANQLAKFMRMDRSYLSRIVNKLEKAGYILRENDPNDKRIFRLFLTDEGEALNRYIEEQSNKQILELLHSLETKEITQLETAMNTIETILGQVVPKEMEEN
ncbi:MarR family winged helix-turn-helix transcriptional regulator [Enterococcus pallens]|uniref:HTH marR-type domain-containing protein n=1 Tax=Enterococcus pallens ATCC BAA-351 TaxID=1158607 RepID=R2Q5F1_9ENTE|nr:MarR family transcriptional regulator [Enterococcus pallens]EOH91772.1 hypothetical protein UAU_03074 [Enterococcus pallens ATCC BAA-351]EOU25200.1 hypothetical protein I588_01188 [Enterococcus pallens ATCC BAA-351]OJG80001.1 hypothetical protein RV10_GL005071 [Enterococcus pallens]